MPSCFSAVIGGQCDQGLDQATGHLRSLLESRSTASARRLALIADHWGDRRRLAARCNLAAVPKCH
jgi:hypothetical protein